MVDLFYQNLPERFELHPEYLTYVSLDAMIEIDNYCQGKSDEFTNVKEFARLLDKYPFYEPNCLLAFDALYSPLQRVFQKNPAKEMKTTDALMLEVRLLQYTLRDVPHLPKEQMESLKQFIGDLVEQFQVECYDFGYGRRRCA